jgi:hypothetical protein
MGEVRQRSFLLHGIPLRRAHATVIDGQVVRSQLPDEAPALLPGQARVAASEATALAREHVARGLTSPAIAAGEGELVYLIILGVPVLAYEVDMALSLDGLGPDGPQPSKKTVWISADSGIVLDEWEHVRASKAGVFLTNPATTPEPIVVELSGVHAVEAGKPLVGDRLQSYNCTLEPQDPEGLPDWWKEGKCYPVHTALSNADGDFFPPLPDIVLPADNAAADDLYAELSMYWHAERFLDKMAALGVTEFKCAFSTMLANYRNPELSPSYPDLDYTPLNNAYWTNECDENDGVTMIFGQGSDVDFGYDGDVVYHELGHGMVSLLTPEGLGASRLRHDAVLTDAGGINEAMADYFSVILTNDSELGDYVARFWPGYGDSIRSAENLKTCPDDTIGQVHNDGEPFMAAMWATRKRVGSDKLDPLALKMLTTLPVDADLETASGTMLELAEADGWTATELAHLARAFETRGIFDCPRVITDPARVSSGRTMYLQSKGAAVTPFMPGPMQLRHVVPEGTDNVIVKFKAGAEDVAPGQPVGHRGAAQARGRADRVHLHPDGARQERGREQQVVGARGDLRGGRLGSCAGGLVAREQRQPAGAAWLCPRRGCARGPGEPAPERLVGVKRAGPEPAAGVPRRWQGAGRRGPRGERDGQRERRAGRAGAGGRFGRGELRVSG